VSGRRLNVCVGEGRANRLHPRSRTVFWLVTGARPRPERLNHKIRSARTKKVAVIWFSGRPQEKSAFVAYSMGHSRGQRAARRATRSCARSAKQSKASRAAHWRRLFVRMHMSAARSQTLEFLRPFTLISKTSCHRRWTLPFYPTIYILCVGFGILCDLLGRSERKSRKSEVRLTAVFLVDW